MFDSRGSLAGLGVLACVACQGFPGPKGPPPEPVPPPAGLPHPRLWEMPAAGDPDPPTPPDRRFPSSRAAQREAEQEQARAEAERRRELAAAPFVEACRDVPLEDRLTCPIVAEEVAATEDIARGIRLVYRDRAVSAERLRRLIGCQAGLARAHPAEPPFCPFFDAQTEKLVLERNGRVMIELTDPDGDGVGVLRERVRTALGR